jgi:hypothetical protein
MIPNMNRALPFVLAAIFLSVLSTQAHAFCGFFVSKAGADLFNEASKVIISRAEKRTVITMANDFKGDAQDFAIVVPVPTLLEEGQVNVAENRIIEHLDAYTAPRLVEYFDGNPCQPKHRMEMMAMSAAPSDANIQRKSADSLGVKIEAEYSVGEYDIKILSAEQSDGLYTWLNQEGYTLPEGADRILGSYIKQDMKFFVAKVNLEEQSKLGYTFLRPLQVAYEHEKFMLPIRLGTLNANGPQDIIVYALTRKGRVETANYRTVKMPSNIDIPIYVKDDFATFYKAMFRHQAEKEGMKSVFLEYAWDMSWCDPCAADPLPNADLRKLGVWWLDNGNSVKPPVRPMPGQPRSMPVPPNGGPQDVFVTRLHARYTAETFPEDLMLHETSDRSNFQGRYILRHPFKGEASCEAAETYFRGLPTRFEKEAQTLVNLTGWNITDVRSEMKDNGQNFSGTDVSKPKNWWDRMWDK